jgi:hypothetical protein
MTNESPQDALPLATLLKIFFLVVLSNIALYLLIVYFAIVNFHRSVPLFLSFIQFLAFILPIALILRIGLKEAPAAGPVENTFLKKIGATPTLVVLSSFAAFFATFTPLGTQMFPQPDGATSLVAKVGVACRVESDLSASKGAYFLTLIWSDDTDYITKVRRELSLMQAGSKPADDSSLYRTAESGLARLLQTVGVVSGPRLTPGERSFSQIKFVEKADPFYKLLKQDPQASKESYDLHSYLVDDLRWIAFTTPVKEPDAYTQVPIYTRVDTRNHTRVFLVTFPDDAASKNVW